MDDCGTSARSATTRGGVDFDDLVTGRVGPSYTFRLTRIINTDHAATQRDPKNTTTNTKGDQDYNALHRATDTLVKWVDDTITDIEIQSGKKVVKFYIGKTYVRQYAKRKFDSMNPNTWKLSGISSRWHHHRQEDYGRNGMVVLTVVTRDDVPQQSIPAFKNQEMYALALEQQLIIHYAFVRGDERLANTSTHPGLQQKGESTRAIGYPIYMAFALDDSQTDLGDDSGTDQKDEVQEGDGEGPYNIVTDESGSSAGKETTERLRNVGLTEEQEEAIHGTLGELKLLPLEKESLQPALNSGNSNKRHIHFSTEETICGIDSVSWVSPELPMSNRDDKIDSFTQPQGANLLTQNERNPAEADTIYHLSSERKGPFTKMLENFPSQKEQWPTNSSSSGSKSRHQLKTSNPLHVGVLAEPGECKEMPIVIIDGEEIMQLEDQGRRQH